MTAICTSAYKSPSQFMTYWLWTVDHPHTLHERINVESETVNVNCKFKTRIIRVEIVFSMHDPYIYRYCYVCYDKINLKQAYLQKSKYVT